MTQGTIHPAIQEAIVLAVGGDVIEVGPGTYVESSPALADCTFSENAAYSGGGMYNRYNSRPTLNGCTFSGNSAEDDDGGVSQGLFLYEKGFVRPIFISGQMLDGRAVSVLDFAQEGLSGHRLVFSVLYLVSQSPFVLGQADYLATIPLFADPDGDGDVDHIDAATFMSCMAGPNVLPNPPQQRTTVQECLDAFDGDMGDDVDLTDFAKFQMAFSGD